MTKESTTNSNDGEKEENQGKNIELPRRLFKYYKYDDMYNELMFFCKSTKFQ